MLFSPGWRGHVRQGEVLAVFTLGLVLGGTLSATVIWLLSGLAAPLPSYARTAAILAVAAVGVLREFGVIAVPLPQNARQIPQDVLQARLRRGSLQFGFELGTGVRTYVSASSPYVLAAGLFLSGAGAPAVVAAGTAFGAGRALSAALTYLSRDLGRAAAVAVRMPLIRNAAATATLAALTVLLVV
ncbi:hypothetical protein [Actinomadura yumaensis]|uniref:Uncharacterized protein n=1 Tax=Actinomadura yumaensis TaxID=111807 RepID=A0ABW2CVE5_9ACTN